jgi:hypothetical protein
MRDGALAETFRAAGRQDEFVGREIELLLTRRYLHALGAAFQAT